jgi:hypothetical protein
MARFNSALKHVKVAAPCSADWDAMIGNDRARFCGQCSLTVYNLSAMTKWEAESFIAGSEGRVCIRYYRRADGSILTDNCPVGLRAIRRRVSYVKKAVTSAVLSFLAGLGLFELASSMEPLRPQRLMGEMVREVNPSLVKRAEPAIIVDYADPPSAMGRLVRISPPTSRRKKGQASNR